MLQKRNFKFNLLLCVCSLLFTSTLNGQTTWYKYENNPVLQRDTVIANLPNDLIAISDPWVLFEDGVYKMWYTCGGLNYPPDTLLRSRICYATSTDGINWEKYEDNPVMDVDYSGSWDSSGVETVTIIIDNDAPATERYKMWYAGQYFNTYRYDIGYAYSPDGINWTKHPAPVMNVGSASEWDSGFLEGPSVIKEDGQYKMWYCGYDIEVNGQPSDGKANIGYATSTDGINWTKYENNPILVTGNNTWDSIYVQDPHVIKYGDEYQMWYGGGDNDSYYSQQVGYATSTDGINWNKSPLNPVLTRGNDGDWDKILASFPSVIVKDGVYQMWYTGRNLDPVPENSLDYYWELGLATAPFSALNNFIVTDNLRLFPNPAQNNITLQFTNAPDAALISIYNNIGECLFTQHTGNIEVLNIDLQSWTNGMYIMAVQSENINELHKFIIAK